MKIQVLGPGCPRCNQLYAAVDLAVRQLRLDCELSKVTDISEITSFGVMVTPALVVDGEVKFSGKVPRVEELKELLSLDAG